MRSRNIFSSPKLPTLLLHCCCAPCATYVLEHLRSSYEIKTLFYNPNIMPQEEHDIRHGEFKKLLSLSEYSNITEVSMTEYSISEFYEVAEPHIDEPEGGQRCMECFRLRLGKTAEYAVSLGCGQFATTLTVSPRKNADIINEIGSQVAQIHGCDYLVSNFKKQGGYQRSIELSKQFGLYRQRYCGCVMPLTQQALPNKI